MFVTAKAQLGVVSEKCADGSWLWSLPTSNAAKKAEDRNPQTPGYAAELGA